MTTSEFHDYYEVLGVKPDASTDDIAAAFKRAANFWHPDHNKSAAANRMMVLVNEAHRALRDPTKRARYDQGRMAGPTRPPPGKAPQRPTQAPPPASTTPRPHAKAPQQQPPTTSVDRRFMAKWGSHGSGDGQFNSLRGVAVDGQGPVYVADSGNARIQKFSGAGLFMTKWGSSGSGDGQFNDPDGIAVDSQGNVYVTDRLNHRVQKFSGAGRFMTKWGAEGSGDGQFSGLYAVCVDGQGSVYTVDIGIDRIQKFSGV